MRTKFFFPAVALAILIGSCAQADKTGSIGGKFSAPLFVQDKVLDALPQNVSHFTVNADAGTQIQAGDGATILVPAGSFADKNGKVVEGNVDLKYKSINTVAEIVASGVPMQVNYEGRSEQFISDGMFEITASQDGEPLEIASGKSISVFTPGRDVESAFKYWYFDKLSGNWAELGDRTRMSSGADIKSEITQMGIDANSGITAYNWTWKKDRGNGIFTFASDPPMQVAPNKTIPGKYDKKKSILDINFDKKRYPELAPYSRVMWQFAGTDAAQDPDRNKWIYESEWWDVQLNPIAGNKNLFRLSFLVNQREFVTTVSPVVSGKDQALAEKELRAELERMQVEKERIKQQGAAVETIEQNMYNAFRVRSMGTYNCDRFYGDPQARTLDLEFMYEAATLDKAKYIYILCENKKNVITYRADCYKFTLNPKLVDAMFIVAANGTLAVAGAEQLGNASESNGKSRTRIVFEKLKQKINSLASLDEAIQKL